MIRVLQWRIGPAGDGVTRAILSTCAHLESEKVHIDYVTGERDIASCQELLARSLPGGGEGSRVFSLPLSPLRQPLRYRRAVEELLDQGFDLLHVNASYFLSAALLQQARKRGMRVVLHAHSADVDVMGGLKRWIFRLLHRFNRRRAVRTADCLLTASSGAARWMFGRDAGRARLHPTGIERAAYAFCPEERERVRRELGAAPDTPVFGHVGRFAYPKNHEFVLKVFAALRRRTPGAVLWLVGTGEREPEIRALVREWGLQESVRFLGLRDDVPSLLQAMDALLMPSRFEGLGLALIEAQTAGLPCLASAAVPDEAAVTGRLKRLPLTVSPEEWAEEMLRLMRTYGPETRAGADQELPDWDAARQARRMQELYEDLCTSRPQTAEKGG
ncbi:MAG: glycosyltransferase family 1 protein [Clostridiales bacterium]|nr:glycosyltransferase family 1 protein [Clostridiales bacterium]